MKDLHFEYDKIKETLDFKFLEGKKQIKITGSCTQIFTNDENNKKLIHDYLEFYLKKNSDNLTIEINTDIKQPDDKKYYLDSKIFKILTTIINGLNEKNNIKLTIKIPEAGLVYKNMYSKPFTDLSTGIKIECDSADSSL